MQNIKLTIEYNGAGFNGWQIQPGRQRTVQGELQKALKRITGKKIPLIGSGRTDKGVHALGQTAHFKADTKISLRQIPKAFNAHLPDDIAVISAKKVSDTFHAQYSAKSKTYQYLILNDATRSVFYKNRALLYPYPLDTEAMKKCAEIFVGTHDFKSFQAKDNSKPHRQEDTIRTVKSLKITRKGKFILMEIEADGFLYKMVRNITGTLLDVGSGRLAKQNAKNILKAKNRSLASPTAGPEGLYLLKVKY